MRTTPFITAASFLLLLAVAACGGSRGDGTTGHDGGHPLDAGPRTDMGPPRDGGSGLDSGSSGLDSGSSGLDSGSGADAAMCVMHCSIDYDCQHSCPATAGRVQCCDRASGRCFGTSGSVCPMSGTDGGSTAADGSMY